MLDWFNNILFRVRDWLDSHIPPEWDDDDDPIETPYTGNYPTYSYTRDGDPMGIYPDSVK
jgi:hypothetical protein